MPMAVASTCSRRFRTLTLVCSSRVRTGPVTDERSLLLLVLKFLASRCDGCWSLYLSLKAGCKRFIQTHLNHLVVPSGYRVEIVCSFRTTTPPTNGRSFGR